VQKNPHFEVRKEQILSGIGEDPNQKIQTNQRFSQRKTLEIIRTTCFCKDLD